MPDPELRNTQAAHRRTMAQRRAAFALEQVRILIRDYPSLAESFRTRANELPAMILSNGLGQAAAFYRMKTPSRSDSKNHGHGPMYQILESWLCREQSLFDDPEDLLTAITTADMSQYLAAQAEALLLLDWVRKFARAFIESSSDKSENATL